MQGQILGFSYQLFKLNMIAMRPKRRKIITNRESRRMRVVTNFISLLYLCGKNIFRKVFRKIRLPRIKILTPKVPRLKRNIQSKEKEITPTESMRYI